MRTLSLSFQPTSAAHKFQHQPMGRRSSVILVFGLCCALLIASSAVTAYGINNPQGKIKHVIIVVQENRTPDNLFFCQQRAGGERWQRSSTRQPALRAVHDPSP